MNKPIYLDDVPSVMSLEELPKKILVPNPERRELVITPEESGYYDAQVFTSDCLPKEIPYSFLGFVLFPNGNIYPKYRADVVTKTELELREKSGYEDGINAINTVARWFTWQENMLEVESIKKLDLRLFDYKSEEFSYWLASPASYSYGVYTRFGPGYVASGCYCKIDNMSLYLTRGNYWITKKRMPVRPVMTLASKVQVNGKNLNNVPVSLL